MGGACISFNGWAMKKKGPVLVSMFSPIGTVCSVVLSVITLGESISVGRYFNYLVISNSLLMIILQLSVYVRKY